MRKLRRFCYIVALWAIFLSLLSGCSADERAVQAVVNQFLEGWAKNDIVLIDLSMAGFVSFSDGGEPETVPAFNLAPFYAFPRWPADAKPSYVSPEDVKIVENAATTSALFVVHDSTETMIMKFEMDFGLIYKDEAWLIASIKETSVAPDPAP